MWITQIPTHLLVDHHPCVRAAAREDLEVIHMDAGGAFIHGIHEETLFIKPPKGYICKSQGTNIVLRLRKPLYGLRQSHRYWYPQLSDFFKSINFIPSTADPCVFISNNSDRTCGVHVHVGDLCIMGHDTLRFKKLINTCFTMEDL